MIIAEYVVDARRYGTEAVQIRIVTNEDDVPILVEEEHVYDFSTDDKDV